MCASFCAVAADPDVALVVDVDAVVRLGPFVALARAAPARTRLPAGSNSSTGGAARSIRLGGLSSAPRLVRRAASPAPRWMIQTWSCSSTHTPIVHAEQPVVRQRLRPQRIDLEHRRLHAAAPARSALFSSTRLADAERDNERAQRRADIKLRLSRADGMHAPPSST